MDVQEGSGYFVCTIAGKWNTDELTDFMDTVSSEVAQRKYKCILADMSRVVGPPLEMDRFHVGRYFASVFRGVKTAIIYRKVYSNRFFEDTAFNRGAWVKVFSDRPSALKWLLEE